MSKSYWPTGPAESLRTREFAEAEWSRLVSSAARDKSSFLNELKDINDRIIGLKQTLPPLNIPQTVSYQEKPKDYGFVIDSNMRLASSSSLSAAKGLRENLARMINQQPLQNNNIYSKESSLSAHNTKRTDFNILSSAMHVESSRPDDHHREDPSLRPLNGYLVPSTEPVHENVDAQKDTAFANALEAFRAQASSSRADNQYVLPQTTGAVSTIEVSTALDSAVKDGREINRTEEMEEECTDEQGEEGEEESECGEDEDDADENDQDEAVSVAEMNNSVSAVPATSAPMEFVPPAIPVSVPTVSPAPILAEKVVDNPVPLKQLDSTRPVVELAEYDRPEPAPLTTKPDVAGIKGPIVETVDQLSRLQAWELELQEREQKVLQYMNSLSRPIGAKMNPKQLSDDQEQDRFEQRYGERSRRDEPVSALRGSADIHIHNHITPSVPAFAPAPASVQPRSSLYDSYQRSSYTPSKYEYGTASVEPTRAYTVPEPRPSVQTRYPQRSEIRSNYAFPPAPYSSLNSGSTNVDLSGLSLERMRELAGHY